MTLSYSITVIGGKRVRSKTTGKLGKMRAKRFIVIRTDSTIKGFGRTRFAKNFATRAEAQAWIDAVTGT